MISLTEEFPILIISSTNLICSSWRWNPFRRFLGRFRYLIFQILHDNLLWFFGTLSRTVSTLVEIVEETFVFLSFLAPHFLVFFWGVIGLILQLHKLLISTHYGPQNYLLPNVPLDSKLTIKTSPHSIVFLFIIRRG